MQFLPGFCPQVLQAGQPTWHSQTGCSWGTLPGGGRDPPTMRWSVGRALWNETLGCFQGCSLPGPPTHTSTSLPALCAHMVLAVWPLCHLRRIKQGLGGMRHIGPSCLGAPRVDWGLSTCCCWVNLTGQRWVAGAVGRDTAPRQALPYISCCSRNGLQTEQRCPPLTGTLLCLFSFDLKQKHTEIFHPLLHSQMSPRQSWARSPMWMARTRRLAPYLFLPELTLAWRSGTGPCLGTRA